MTASFARLCFSSGVCAGDGGSLFGLWGIVSMPSYVVADLLLAVSSGKGEGGSFHKRRNISMAYLCLQDCDQGSVVPSPLTSAPPTINP